MASGLPSVAEQGGQGGRKLMKGSPVVGEGGRDSGQDLWKYDTDGRARGPVEGIMRDQSVHVHSKKSVSN